MCFNGFRLNIVIESLNLKTKGAITNYPIQPPRMKPSPAGLDVPTPQRWEIAKPRLYPTWCFGIPLRLLRKHYRGSWHNLENSSDLSCSKKIQVCLYHAWFSPVITDIVTPLRKEGCIQLHVNVGWYGSDFLKGDFREVGTQMKQKLLAKNYLILPYVNQTFFPLAVWLPINPFSPHFTKSLSTRRYQG